MAVELVGLECKGLSRWASSSVTPCMAAAARCSTVRMMRSSLSRRIRHALGPDVVEVADWLRGELGVSKPLWGAETIATAIAASSRPMARQASPARTTRELSTVEMELL
jgi:hypothetical protein